MVKSKVKDESAADAIELLKSEHREVEALFEEFESADPSAQEQVADKICQKLTVHAQIEEEIVYPAAKDALQEDDVDLVNEAEVEHASAKDLIAKIEEMDSTDEAYKATVKVLSEYIKHHVKEEENELFPLLKKSDLDLDAMGIELADRKAELLAELGDDAEGDASDLDDADDDTADEADDVEEEGETVVAKPAAKSKVSRKRP